MFYKKRTFTLPSSNWQKYLAENFAPIKYHQIWNLNYSVKKIQKKGAGGKGTKIWIPKLTFLKWRNFY